MERFSFATSTVRVVVKCRFIFENHPACDGVGWFSCVLEHASERNEHLMLGQSLSKLLVEIQEMFPWLSPPFFKKRKKKDNQPPSQYSVASLILSYYYENSYTKMDTHIRPLFQNLTMPMRGLLLGSSLISPYTYS